MFESIDSGPIEEAVGLQGTFCVGENVCDVVVVRFVAAELSWFSTSAVHGFVANILHITSTGFWGVLDIPGSDSGSSAVTLCLLWQGIRHRDLLPVPNSTAGIKCPISDEIKPFSSIIANLANLFSSLQIYMGSKLWHYL